MQEVCSIAQLYFGDMRRCITALQAHARKADRTTHQQQKSDATTTAKDSATQTLRMQPCSSGLIESQNVLPAFDKLLTSLWATSGVTAAVTNANATIVDNMGYDSAQDMLTLMPYLAR